MIGISGGSASGKTYLLDKLLERYSEENITLVSQDNYYRPIEECPKSDEGEVNFDHPNAIDLDAFVADLEKLSAGKSVTLMEYTFNNPALTPKEITYHPSPIILIEGLFIFGREDLRNLQDLMVYVDADEHIRLSRRIQRDLEERGWKLDEILTYYEKFVMPMYRKYIEPYKYDCDLIIPNNHKMDTAIEVLTNHLDKTLKAVLA